MEFTFIDAVNDLCCLPFDSLEEAHGKDRYRSRHHRWSSWSPEFVAVDRRRPRLSTTATTFFSSSPTSTFPNVFRLCQNTLGVLLSAWR